MPGQRGPAAVERGLGLDGLGAGLAAGEDGAPVGVGLLERDLDLLGARKLFADYADTPKVSIFGSAVSQFLSNVAVPSASKLKKRGVSGSRTWV